MIVGQTFVGTGPMSGLSRDPLAGIHAYLASLNSNGGIRGRQVELRQFDDGYQGDRAANNVRSAAAAGAVAMLLPIGTAPAEGALEAASELKLPVVGAYTGAASLRRFSEVSFPVRISFSEECERIVRHLLTIGITRIAAVHNENPGAVGVIGAARQALERQGHHLVGTAVIRQDAADAAEQARTVATMRCEAVVLAITNESAEKFLPALRAGGSRAQVYSVSLLNARALHGAIGLAANGIVVSQVVPSPWVRSRPVVAEYQQAMQRNGQDLSYGSLEGYISAKVLVEGLQRAGATATPSSVLKALRSMTDVDLGGVRVRYSSRDVSGLGYSELAMLKAAGSYAR